MNDNKKNLEQEKPEFPGQSQQDGIPDSQQEIREPMDQEQEQQSHENRERPREDHGTGHLGYNKTQLDSNPAPVQEGSDKI